MENGQIILQRTYDVPPEQVWEAITGPDQMEEWHLSIDVWKVTEVVPGERISYEWRYQGFPGNSRITFELIPDGDATRITVTHKPINLFAY